MANRTTIVDLRQQRAAVVAQMRALLDAAEADDGRDLTADEAEAWARHEAEIGTLESRIARLEAHEAREADLAASVVATPPAPQPEPETDRVRAFLRGEIRAVEFRYTDRDVRGMIERRDLTKAATAGAELVPTGFVRRLYEHLIETSAIRQTNATVLTTESGESIQVPKTATHGTAGLVTEGGAIAEADSTFGQVTLDAFKYGVLIQVSRELLSDNAVDLLGYLARQAGRALGNASGAHFVTGTGTGQPRGVVPAATVGKTTKTGNTTTVDPEELIDLYHSVIAPYRGGGTFWLMRDASVATIRKLRDLSGGTGTGQFMWQPGLTAGAPDTLLGRPVVVDPNVAAMAANAKSIVFGDFSGYYIRDVGSVRFERSDDFAFANDLVSFRALIRTDGDLIDTGAVRVLQHAAT